jgi:predicted TIM-barrel fold metal-dependent hydrolase
MIDFHVHPLLVAEMRARHPELDRAASRSGFFIASRAQPLETLLLELEVAGLEQAVLLPIDTQRTRGVAIFTNEQIAELVAMAPDHLIGFASVDPLRKDAVDQLAQAVEELGLRGLKLSPPSQEFYADDPQAYPIYERAQALGIPVVIHTGMSWEPNARLAYGRPLRLEPILVDFPQLRVVATHFGWPWSLELAALAMKYPNLYIDTAALYFDNPEDFLADLFVRQISLTLIERTLRYQVVFGSNYPRVEIRNMARAVRQSGLSEGTLHLLFHDNPLKLLGESNP